VTPSQLSPLAQLYDELDELEDDDELDDDPLEPLLDDELDDESGQQHDLQKTI
jgi:hypothetical protein